jgi:hypothetical protein
MNLREEKIADAFSWFVEKLRVRELVNSHFLGVIFLVVVEGELECFSEALFGIEVFQLVGEQSG